MPDLSTSADAHIFEIFYYKRSKNLIVGFSLDPIARWQSTKEIFSCFVITPDKDGERNGWQPPIPLQRIHPETLKKEAKVKDLCFIKLYFSVELALFFWLVF